MKWPFVCEIKSILVNFHFGKEEENPPLKNVFILARRASILYFLKTFCLKPL